MKNFTCSRTILLASGQRRSGVPVSSGHRPVLVRSAVELDAHWRHLWEEERTTWDCHLHRAPILEISVQRQGSGTVPTDRPRTAARFGQNRRRHGLGPQRQNLLLQRHHVLEIRWRGRKSWAGLPQGHVHVEGCAVQHRFRVPVLKRLVFRLLKLFITFLFQQNGQLTIALETLYNVACGPDSIRWSVWP